MKNITGCAALAASLMTGLAGLPAQAQSGGGAVSPGLIPSYSSIFGLPPNMQQKPSQPSSAPQPFVPGATPNAPFVPGAVNYQTYQTRQPTTWRSGDGWREPQAGSYPQRQNWGNDYVYGSSIVTSNGTTITTNGPVLLGGYDYGNYCNADYGHYCYPSVFSLYVGFPQYIYNPAVVVLDQPNYPIYDAPSLPFPVPTYNVTYNQTNYYNTNEGQTNQGQAVDAQPSSEGAPPAKAYPVGTYQAAFTDIARAWTDGNVTTLRKHIRSEDTKISVFLNSKYSYSIASSDFAQITKDAFDRLNTVSFTFTRIRKSDNGDVTAYGQHVYRVGTTVQDGDQGATQDNTVPFDQATPGDITSNNNVGVSVERTMYVSYTLRHADDQWYIISTDSSPDPLVK